MASYQVKRTDSFAADFLALPKTDQQLVIRKIEGIRNNPNRSRYFLHAPLNKYRRAYIGDRYRLIFKIVENTIYLYFIEPKTDKTYKRIEARVFKITQKEKE